jgi:hypothetical protein
MALGALSLLACAVPLDREVVVFVFGFASVRCRHSLRPCPSVPACCVFGCGRLDGCFVQLSGWLGWCWCRAVSGLVCGSPACWKGGKGLGVTQLQQLCMHVLPVSA